jgi:hypothetical protein
MNLFRFGLKPGGAEEFGIERASGISAMGSKEQAGSIDLRMAQNVVVSERKAVPGFRLRLVVSR